MRRKGNVWTPEEIERLKALTESGATVTRAAGALKRSTSGVQAMARKLGKPLVGPREAAARARHAEQSRPK
jgi:hypothetical protein